MRWYRYRTSTLSVISCRHYPPLDSQYRISGQDAVTAQDTASEGWRGSTRRCGYMARHSRWSLPTNHWDIAVVLVGLWPMVTDGARAMQVVLALLLIDATRRLRFESPPVFAAGMLLLTAILCGYVLWVAQYGEEWGSAVVWGGLLIGAAMLSLMAYRRQMLRPARVGHGAAVAVDRLRPEIEASPQPPVLEPETSLSPRQREVARLLASGMSTREIADELSLSIDTVRGHLKGIYRTLRTHDRDEAVRRAREHGDLS